MPLPPATPLPQPCLQPQMQQLLMLADPAAALLRRRQTPKEPLCGGACEWMVENVVAKHVRARGREVGGFLVGG
jgi:hypothetical protein